MPVTNLSLSPINDNYYVPLVILSMQTGLRCYHFKNSILVFTTGKSSVRERPLGLCCSLLGGVALRDHAAAQATCDEDRGSNDGGTRWYMSFFLTKQNRI